MNARAVARELGVDVLNANLVPTPWILGEIMELFDYGMVTEADLQVPNPWTQLSFDELRTASPGPLARM